MKVRIGGKGSCSALSSRQDIPDAAADEFPLEYLNRSDRWQFVL